MGSSLILTGGAAVTKTLKEAITQTAHGFTVGDVIRWNPTSSPPKYVLAQADSAANAEVAGVVSSRTDSNNFEVTYHGYIDLPQFSGISAPVMFLSSVAGGSLSSTPPSAVGTVVKPILTRNTNGSGHLVMNYLGTQIGGSSTISVDEIQPVGTITPFAGNAIPDTWLECNGASYSISSYPELYAKLKNSSGAAVPAYGYIATLTGPGAGTANFALGDMVQFKTTAGTFSGGLYDSNADIIGIIISISGTVPITASGTITVQILPNYNSNTKSFQFPNAIFTAGIGTPTSTGSGNYRVLTTPASTVNPSNGAWRGGNANLTVSAVEITHFNTPDLRGRFAIGTNTSPLGELESDVTNISAISGIYSLGSEGGEEKHTLTIAEMPAHKHKFVDWGGSQFAPSGTQYDLATVANGNYGYADTDTKPSYGNASDSGPSAVGENTAHNNIPPYLAVRYIIKAKPYTRAAIVDGIDLPYNNLLVRDLRSRNVGGSNGDLVFHTNTSGDSGNGTERMRLTNDGKLVVGYSSAVTTPNPLLVFGSQFSANYPVNAVLMDTDNPAVGKGGGIAFAGKPSTAADPASSGGRALFASIGGYKENSTDGDYAGYLSLNTRVSLGNSAVERVRITSTGNVGIGTATPGASLDVNGTLKVGDFGGTTNVMAKLNNTIAGGLPSVGCVLPMYASSQYASVLPAGTWFVFMEWDEGDGTTADEDAAFIMAKVWTVPTGQFLKFKNTATTSSHTASAVYYKIGTDSTNDVTDTGWIEFKSQGTGKNAYDLTLTIGETTTNGENFGVITLTSNTALAHGMGYAIRIA